MTDAPKHYRIVELRVEGIKRISVVNIRPDGNIVQLVGDNGAGKSSILNAIEWAFAGKRAIQAKPIRAGEETALIKVDLGDLKVTRRFTATDDGGYTTSVKIEGPDGYRSTEQGILNALIGEFAFDPVAFGRMKPDEQFASVTTLVPGVDFTAIAKADKEDFDARTDVNRRAKALRTQVDAIALPPGGIPAVVDVAALEKQLGDAAEHNSLLERRRAGRGAAEERIQAAKDRATGLREQARVLIEQAEEEEGAATALQEQVDKAEALPEPIDVTAVREQLAGARLGNEVAARFAERERLSQEADKAEAQSAELTKSMEQRETAKQKAIAAAKMPVKGLSFGAGVVLLNGQPFDQASTAQQWVAAVGIAAALNPRLRVIHIKDGSLIGKGNMEVLAKMAEELDLQIWVERLEASKGVGFELIDGHLKGAPPPAKTAPSTDDVI